MPATIPVITAVRKLSRVPAVIACLFAALSAIPAPAQQAQPFSADAVKPEAVHAGAISAGFFHATIAAMAANDPKLLASRIESTGNDYIVHFADGKLSQHVTVAEAEALRSSGYDRSDGLWVAVLYRGYEMRVLYDAIHFSIGHLNFSPGIKAKAAKMMDDSEWLVMDFDRAIREKISPTGELDADQLRLAVREQLKSSGETEDSKKSAENVLLSLDMFHDTADAVKRSGEMFGAYKAEGNIGLPDRIVEAFAGKGRGMDKLTQHDVTDVLKGLREKKYEAIVSTPDLTVTKLKTRPAAPLPWYLPLHAYTVVSETATTVTLRNPCMDEPKATFKVPAASMPSLFSHVSLQE